MLYQEEVDKISKYFRSYTLPDVKKIAYKSFWSFTVACVASFGR